MIQDLLLVSSISLFASFLTFFSGFGLGTLLTPFFYLIFKDITLAIASTAVVHLLNNLFKFLLLRKSIRFDIALKFGIPAIFAAIGGAFLLKNLNDISLYSYTLGSKEFTISAIKLALSIPLIFFSAIELVPGFKLNFKKSFLPVGGLISGFFGGLTGHQGALRTAFLLKYNLPKEVFIATGVVIATMIDIPRIFVYYEEIVRFDLNENFVLILSCVLSAFSGAIIGKLLLKKITLEKVHLIVGVCMIIFSVALGMGLI
ncbi:MAG: sulfite exporter TauE/SafE family protein [Crocinitomicaceae bacterium]|nr:sulfite exporter TauE/SafE family protein [Crocinitomicaceae bacterium]